MWDRDTDKGGSEGDKDTERRDREKFNVCETEIQIKEEVRGIKVQREEIERSSMKYIQVFPHLFTQQMIEKSVHSTTDVDDICKGQCHEEGAPKWKLMIGTLAMIIWLQRYKF